ncbi:MAG: hypothetical protein Q616_SPPC00488G0002, partial [Streptococcus parasanguinis DORA_23_24]
MLFSLSSIKHSPYALEGKWSTQTKLLKKQ